MRIGVFGGSFDPIHTGHLILAETAREAAALDEIRFVPVATNPLKPDGPRASNRQRAEMIRLAIGGHTGFTLDEIELKREGISYTVDTLAEFHQQNPGDEWFLIMGSDSLRQFDRWKDAARICELAIPLVAPRHGSEIDLDLFRPWTSESRMQEIREHAFAFPRIELSSTELRERIGQSRSIRYRTPRSVECYIDQANLYAPPTQN